MKEFELTKAQEEILRCQVIDASQPGPILHDFQVVLDFVGVEGVEAAGKYNLLPLSAIGKLDERLSRPLHLAMKRPQLRSHPYLQGLHLLLRASTLSRVEGTGAKARLVVDPVMLEPWQRLNATEQYFTLLEAWLRLGRPEMIGERESRFGGLLSDCLMTWRHLSARGQKLDISRPQNVSLFGICRNLYQLALMDLFGLVQVEHPRSAVQPWVPAGVKHLPFGDAVFTLLGQHTWPFVDLDREDDAPEEEEPAEASLFGEWQPLFQPYFPEWQNNLAAPPDEAREGVFVFRVSLGKVWREIAMPADASLDNLVGWILHSVDFDEDHLYEITFRDRFGATVRAGHPDAEGDVSAAEVCIGDLPLDPGQSMKLLYDFGDSWKFDVKLERIEPSSKKLKKPKILKKQGKSPEQYPDTGW